MGKQSPHEKVIKECFLFTKKGVRFYNGYVFTFWLTASINMTTLLESKNSTLISPSKKNYTNLNLFPIPIFRGIKSIFSVAIVVKLDDTPHVVAGTFYNIFQCDSLNET